jgi:hypothetical protein
LYTAGYKLNVKYVKQHGNRAVKKTPWWYMNEEEKRKVTNLERINTLVTNILQNGMT